MRKPEPKPKPDFEYMHSLLLDFFRRPATKAALRVIDELSITGWEVWFQVEFARFLAEHGSEPEWARELSYQYDWRKEKQRHYFRPDFIIRKKHWPLERFIALEIKQHSQMGNCLTNMVADLKKVARIRKSELDVRSIWALGIFPSDVDVDIDAAIEEKLGAAGQIYYPDRVLAGKISRTPFSFALF